MTDSRADKWGLVPRPYLGALLRTRGGRGGKPTFIDNIFGFISSSAGEVDSALPT